MDGLNEPQNETVGEKSRFRRKDPFLSLSLGFSFVSVEFEHHLQMPMPSRYLDLLDLASGERGPSWYIVRHW